MKLRESLRALCPLHGLGSLWTYATMYYGGRSTRVRKTKQLSTGTWTR